MNSTILVLRYEATAEGKVTFTGSSQELSCQATTQNMEAAVPMSVTVPLDILVCKFTLIVNEFLFSIVIHHMYQDQGAWI